MPALATHAVVRETYHHLLGAMPGRLVVDLPEASQDEVHRVIAARRPHLMEVLEALLTRRAADAPAGPPDTLAVAELPELHPAWVSGPTANRYGARLKRIALHLTDRLPADVDAVLWTPAAGLPERLDGKDGMVEVGFAHHHDADRHARSVYRRYPFGPERPGHLLRISRAMTRATKAALKALAPEARWSVRKDPTLSQGVHIEGAGPGVPAAIAALTLGAPADYPRGATFAHPHALFLPQHLLPVADAAAGHTPGGAP